MPTFVHGKNAKVLIGNDDFTTSFKEFSFSTNIDMAETSAFGNQYKTYVQGLGDSTISLSGMWSGGTDEVDEALGSYIGAAGVLPVIIAPNGYGVGKTAMGLGAQESSYEVTASIGDVVAISAEFTAATDTGGKSGKLLFPGTALSATGNQTSVDNGAATTNGGYALLVVPSNTRSADSVITIEDSADNVSFATIATFTTIASATTETSEYLAISGNIRRYVRAVLTLTAGTGDITPHVLIVRAS